MPQAIRYLWIRKPSTSHLIGLHCRHPSHHRRYQLPISPASSRRGLPLCKEQPPTVLVIWLVIYSLNLGRLLVSYRFCVRFYVASNSNEKMNRSLTVE